MTDIPVVLNVHLQALAGRERELETQLRALIEPTRREAGCLAYELHSDPEDPGKFMFYEKFRSQAALDQHVSSAHFKKFLEYRSNHGDPIESTVVTKWVPIV